MQRTQPSRPLVEQHRPARPLVQEGMDGSDQKIKGHSPETQVGEVAEGATAVAGLVVGAIPAKDEEDGEEDEEGDEGAHAEEEKGRQEPGGFEAVMAVIGWICAHEADEGTTRHDCCLLSLSSFKLKLTMAFREAVAAARDKKESRRKES
jgi:hypothetical protein